MENPKKSLQEYYEQLKGINEDFKRTKFFSPVTHEQIEQFEKENNMQIPESYKQWLRLSNGGYLFGGYVHLYGIDNHPQPSIGNDFSAGKVPKEYQILGYMESEHICFNKENKNSFLRIFKTISRF